MSHKHFVIAAALVALSVSAHAAPIACAGVPPAITLDTYPPAGASNVSYSCGPLTISKVKFTPASGGVTYGQFDLAGSFYDPIADFVSFVFNPNMVNPTNGSLDFHLSYMITGLTNGVGQTVGGQNASITKTVCSEQIDEVNGNICTGGLIAQLAVVTGFSGEATKYVQFPNDSFVSKIYVFDDVNVASGGGLTNFSQRFDTSPVPEPGTYALMGAGLGLIALSRRSLARP